MITQNASLHRFRNQRFQSLPNQSPNNLNVIMNTHPIIRPPLQLRSLFPFASWFVLALLLFTADFASGQHFIGLKMGLGGNRDQQLTNTAAGPLQPTDLAGAPGYQQTNWNVLGRYG